MMNFTKANNLLITLIILINTYLIAAPFYPHLNLWWQTHILHTGQKLDHNLRKAAKGHPKSSTPKIARQGEWLIIPKLALDAPIYEGKTIATANKGIWRRPASSTPQVGGNTVLAGHRFTYTNPKGIFYNLDKLELSDIIAVYSDKKQYTYKVSAIKVVKPDEVSIEAPTNDDRLTIYTCTPLWSPKNRLVVIATRSSL